MASARVSAQRIGTRHAQSLPWHVFRQRPRKWRRVAPYLLAIANAITPMSSSAHQIPSWGTPPKPRPRRAQTRPSAASSAAHTPPLAQDSSAQQTPGLPAR